MGFVTRSTLFSTEQMQHAADEQVLVADHDWHEDLSCMYLPHHELESS